MVDFFKMVIYRGGAAFGTLLFTLNVYFTSSTEQSEVIFNLVLFLYSLSIITRLGLDALLVKDLTLLKGKQQRLYFLRVVYSALIAACTVTSVIMILYFYLYNNTESLKYTFINLLPFTFLGIYSFYFRAKNLKFYSALSEPGSMFFMVAIIAYLNQEQSILSVITYTNWSVFSFFSLLLIYRGEIRFKVIELKGIYVHSMKGLSFMLLALLAYLTLWLPAFFIQRVSIESFVDYNLAVRILAPITFMITTVDFYLSTKFSIAVKMMNKKEINLLIKKFRLFFFIAGGGYLIISNYILFFFSEKYLEVSYNVFAFHLILSTGYYLSSIIGQFGILLNMAGKVNLVNLATLLSALYVFILLYPSYYLGGVIGVVILTASSITLRNVNLFYLKVKYSGV